MNARFANFFDQYGSGNSNDPVLKSSCSSLPEREALSGWSIVNTKGISNGSLPGADDHNTTRISTAQLVDFTKEQAKRRPIKEVARLTGLSLKAVESIRSGEAAASGTTISTWCKNCPEFRTEYFRWVGGYMETDPQFVPALYAAIRAVIKEKGGI